MLKFLKNILPAKKEQVFTLNWKEIPAFLDERGKTARERLEQETEIPKKNVRNAAASLQLIVNNLKGAEQDPETHPKIKSIAKNSLPLFLKAMNAALAKELPGDTHGFYTEAVEMVKSCLNAVRGQGRYLMVAFPAEMKDAKNGIDAIGREINVMTGALARYKKETEYILAIKEVGSERFRMQEELVKSVEKEGRITARIHEITGRISAIKEETGQLSNDESHHSLTVQKAQHAELEKKRDSMMRTYASLSMTASHVFRKAEKIAQRKHETADMHTLRKTMEILSDHHVPDPADITAALTLACPVARRMIDNGEIALKNKEERSMFADTEHFCTELTSAGKRYRELFTQCEETGNALATHPVIARMDSLEREGTQLRHMQVHEEKTLNELLEWRKKTKQAIPQLKEELEKRIGEMIGETVQILGDDTVPV